MALFDSAQLPRRSRSRRQSSAGRRAGSCRSTMTGGARSSPRSGSSHGGSSSASTRTNVIGVSLPSAKRMRRGRRIASGRTSALGWNVHKAVPTPRISARPVRRRRAEVEQHLVDARRRRGDAERARDRLCERAADLAEAIAEAFAEVAARASASDGRSASLREQLVAEREQRKRIEEELLDVRQLSGAALSAAFRATTIVDTPNCRISRLRSRRGSASEYHLRARRGSHSYFVNRGSA